MELHNKNVTRHSRKEKKMSMTQEQYNQAHDDAMQAVKEYMSGMILLFELKDILNNIEAPQPIKGQVVGLTDPATGLSF
jgi:hypothetical protein